ncbi:MAG TPA: PEGA domain-containing protein [Polyangiaceae bacterium]
MERCRFVVSLVALTVTLCFGVEPARAQATRDTPAAEASPTPAPSDAKKEEAKARFLRGLSLAKEGAWDAALAEFTASIEIYPTRAALSNAAISLKQLKRYAEAHAAYAELLTKFSDELAADARASVESDMSELRALLGVLEIESQPSGATVVIDGQQRGLTPLAAPILVDAGTHSIRVAKDGFVSYETQLTVASRQNRKISAALRPLDRSGHIVIEEASGAKLDVTIDGAVVGKTPYEGSLAPGTHAVSLRGEGNFGTPPSSAAVRAGESLRLALRAVPLDSELRVEPTPSNARVFIDGVAVGAGVWQGRLGAGSHRVEVTAEGHVADRRNVETARNQRKILAIALERDLTNPMWSGGFSPHVYLELAGGIAATRSLGGSANEACSNPDPPLSSCSEQSQPPGFAGAVRGGYEIGRGVGIELFFAYMRIVEKQTRTLQARADPEIGRMTSDDYRDRTALSLPFAGISASYRFLEKTPFTLRFWAGLARATATTSNRGNFSGTFDDGTDTGTVSGPFSIPETPVKVWAPLVGPEVRFGYRFAKRWSADFGVLALFVFPGKSLRTGSNSFGSGSGQEGRRAAPFPNDVELTSGGTRTTGIVELPREEALGAFFVLTPTIGVRADF